MAKRPMYKLSELKQRRIFLLELGYGLILPNIRCRAVISKLQASIQVAMNMVGARTFKTKDAHCLCPALASEGDHLYCKSVIVLPKSTMIGP